MKILVVEDNKKVASFIEKGLREEGYAVDVAHDGVDAVPHSIGVGEIQTPFPVMFGEPTPVFAGAMSSNPGSMTDSTMPGESETVTFMAERPGTYALVCYIPAHAATGIWITLEVTPDGEVSFDPDP